MLSSGSTRTGTPAAAISLGIVHPSAVPARMRCSLYSLPIRNAVSISLRRLATTISGNWPRRTGSSASRSAAPADRGCIWARLKSLRRRAYSSASSNTRRNRAATPAREPPPASFVASLKPATIAAGDLTRIASIVAPSRSMSAAWPQIRLELGGTPRLPGTAKVIVTPSARETAMSTEAGLMPSSTLNAAATSLPRSVYSLVPCTI